MINAGIIGCGFGGGTLKDWLEHSEYCEQMGADWRKMHTGILLSGYINDTHTYVPGPDVKFGYGGKCFSKDVNAFAKMTEGTPLETLLENLYELKGKIYYRLFHHASQPSTSR